MLTAASLAGIHPTDIGFVDLHRAGDPVTFGPPHRSPQLVQQDEGGLVSAQAELALHLQSRETGRVGGHEIARREPQGQRQPRAVQDRAGRHRRLVPTGSALEQRPPRQRPGLPAAARRAAKALRPTRLDEITPAAFLTSKLLAKPAQCSRKIRPRHARMERIAAHFRRFSTNEPCLVELWHRGVAPGACTPLARGVGDRNEPRACGPFLSRIPPRSEPERLIGARPQTRKGPGIDQMDTGYDHALAAEKAEAAPSPRRQALFCGPRWCPSPGPPDRPRPPWRGRMV
jgi:hypothetical protein